jgi:hypothetical protein
MHREKRVLDPLSIGVLSWAVPGAGHLAMGRWQKGLLYFVLIVSTFAAGWVISDFADVYFQSGRWHIFLQMGAGVVTFILALGRESPEPRLTVMHFFEIGTLYTMVAGLLNVLVVMDSVTTSIRLRREGR